MQVHRDVNQLPSFRNAVITIGTFDGVHTGHLQIIKQLKQESVRVNGESVIITFHPHPRMVVGSNPPAISVKAEGELQPINTISLLNTLDEKIELLEKQGIDHLVIVSFTEQFSLLIPEDYIKEFLVEKFHPNTIIIGYDHHFGKQRKGNYNLLQKYANEFGYIVKEMYQVFNMGCRMEIYADDSFASSIIKAAKNLNIDAQVIGRVEKNNKKELIIKTAHEDLLF